MPSKFGARKPPRLWPLRRSIPIWQRRVLIRKSQSPSQLLAKAMPRPTWSPTSMPVPICTSLLKTSSLVSLALALWLKSVVLMPLRSPMITMLARSVLPNWTATPMLSRSLRITATSSIMIRPLSMPLRSATGRTSSAMRKPIRRPSESTTLPLGTTSASSMALAPIASSPRIKTATSLPSTIPTIRPKA